MWYAIIGLASQSTSTPRTLDLLIAALFTRRQLADPRGTWHLCILVALPVAVCCFQTGLPLFANALQQSVNQPRPRPADRQIRVELVVARTGQNADARRIMA